MKLVESEKTAEIPTPTRKAILWGSENLLVRSVELFLEAGSTWDVLRISTDLGEDVLIGAIKKTDPEVVILCADNEGGSELSLRLISGHPRLKVVVIGLESNLLQVYSSQHVMIEGVSDLLSILEAGNYSDCAPEKEAGLSKKIP